MKHYKLYKSFSLLIIDMANIEIRRIKDIKVKKPTVIIGLPGIGLVGSVCAAQLIDVLKLEFVGYISSPHFAPLAAIHNYTPLPAARIHYSEKYDLVVILSEMSIPTAISQELADGILDFAKSLDASLLISLGGISMKEEKDAIYVVSTEKKIARTLISKKLAKPIKEGATTGVTGLLMAKGAIENFPMILILAEAQPDSVDPAAAVNALKTLSEIINVPIDTTNLEREAKEMTIATKEAVIKSRIPQKKTYKDESDLMYG
jgi:uncharacterized protein